MSASYQAVGWNRNKRFYDLVVAAGIIGYLLLFSVGCLIFRPNISAETLLIRAFGTCALILLHVVLSIGPLCRLDPRFLPLLYNRRHLGVAMFLTALAHGGVSIFQFHTAGELSPLVSVLVSNGGYSSLAWFPFQPLGLAALIILFLMAATSHDFWLANLTPPVWKSLHMLVYLAYGLIVLHVALGALQVEKSSILSSLLILGLLWIVVVHLLAALRGAPLDREAERVAAADGYVEVAHIEDIPEDRAKIVSLGGERVAIFRYGGKISALSNVCAHQNGPLGEGAVIDGCVTCPWHGFQYEPETGSSPPPFNERVPTFRVRVEEGRVLLHPRPNPPGTLVVPALCPERRAGGVIDLFVGYLSDLPAWHGAETAVAGLDGRRVTLEGALIYRDGYTMLELRDGSIETREGFQAAVPPDDLGEITLAGEIVDSKCYLGVMKPGHQKTHRACATLCIRGGVPPLLLVEQTNGERNHDVLVGEDGSAIGPEILEFVTEPVRIRGHERQLGDLRLFAADVSSIERIR
jgi:nitrite reductase/ring-hydroxylating ferredoxin subunit/DMSO/TMAO reductase YedYZ heme-binding membrane subunit